MSQTDNAAPEHKDADDNEAERLFNEFAGDGAAEPQESDDPGTDDESEGEPGGGQPRDDKGRFAAGEEDAGEEPGDQNDPPQETPEQKLERLEREAQQWQHRYQSDLGRQAALQRKIQELQNENQALQKQSRQSAGQAEGDNPDGSGMSDAEWENLKQDFPEIAKGIEQQLGAMQSRYEQRISQLEQQLSPIQAQAEQQAYRAQAQALEAQHPDWREVVQTPDFHAWLREQPPAVQQLTNSEEAADAAFLLQSYKLSQGQAAPQANQGLQQRRQRQLQSARTVPNRGGRQRSAIPDDDEDALFDYFADRADQG